MKCRYFNDNRACGNAKSPFCGGGCPLESHQEACRFSQSRKEVTDLAGKCGSCKHGEVCAFYPGGNLTYIRCRHPEKFFRRDIHAVKQRTCKACNKYEVAG